jgi:hypothetical protein
MPFFGDLWSEKNTMSTKRRSHSTGWFEHLWNTCCFSLLVETIQPSLVGQYVWNYLKPINNMSCQFQLDDDRNVDETIKCIRLSISIMFTPWVIARCSSFDSGACWAGQLWLLTIDVLVGCLYTTMRIMRFIHLFQPFIELVGFTQDTSGMSCHFCPMSWVQDPADWTEEAWNHYIEHWSCGKLRRTVSAWHSHHT